MNKTHSILIEDMRTGQMQVMEFYAYQAALDAIERICDDSDKTTHGPFVLGAAEADETLRMDGEDLTCGGTWVLTKLGQLVKRTE